MNERSQTKESTKYIISPIKYTRKYKLIYSDKNQIRVV